jgi:DNA-binding SARP family transcriptional activator
MSVLRISILGPLTVSDGDRAIHLSGTKKRTLLAWLALNHRRPVSVEALMASLWDDVPPPTAKAKVHTHVCELRKVLSTASRVSTPGWPLLTRQGGYQLSEDVVLDNEQFEADSSKARQASRLGEHMRALELFARALATWRGPALADATSSAAQAAACALNEERLLSIEGKAESEIQLGWYDEVVAELSPMLAANPLRERLRGELMLALYRRGARSEALAVYREGHRTIINDLGMPPIPQLHRLQQYMLRDDSALWTRSPSDLLSMATLPSTD